MKLQRLLVLWAAGLAIQVPGAALKESTFTQVLNDVTVLSTPARNAKPAHVNDLVQAPEVVRTGVKSRAELKAPDQTLTRVGANSVFSFEGDGRNMKLEQGSLLFHSPKGKGGGTIKTGGASAAVLGTTVIVACTANGGFKAIILEGRGRVTLPNGRSVELKAGQLIFVLPGGQEFGPILNINLGKLVAGSNLVRGFPDDLPSTERIEQAIAEQDRKMANGRAEDTNYLVGDSATQNDVKVLDPATQNVGTKSAFGVGLSLDAIISQPTLETSRVLLDAPGFEGGGVFVARNISVTTPSIDLAPYTGLDFFTILANGDLTVFNTVEFVGETGGGSVVQSASRSSLSALDQASSGTAVYLSAVGTLQLKPGVDLVLNGLTDLALLSGESAAFRENGFYAPDGNIGIGSERGDLSFDEVRFQALSEVHLSAAEVLHVDQASFSQGGTSGLALRNVELAGLRSFDSALTISMDARTINLERVSFPDGSTVTLRSELGLLAPNPNTGAASVPGHVNFIRDVTYGETPAQFAVRSPDNSEGRIFITTRQP